MQLQVSPHVASLRTGSGAALSQRALVKSTVAQLMLLESVEEDEDQEEEDEEEISRPEVKGSDLVLPTLESWYCNQHPQISGGRRRPPLIVVLEDFEAFPAHVLQEFILNVA